MSSKVGCLRCGCTDIDKDAATGGAYCTNCGAVLEENAIVAEVEFFETGTGGHGALGQFVSADAPSKFRMGTGGTGVSTKESREFTLQRAKRLIGEVAGQLGGLNQHCKDTALNLFSMALRSGLTRGRRSTHVIAACLYITCRLEGTPHLLLDFSDVLQVNVFELGRTFNFLARKLMIRLPHVDPCDYIMRFAHALNFGDKEHDVAMIALRLVQRMKRDWISFGRRPTGLCGAALLLAARYHNFSRNVNDIVRVVNISDSVIRRRLEEFAYTESSELTLDEFPNVDRERMEDPPAFREARKQEKILKSLEKKLQSTEAQVDAALSATAASKRGPYAKYAKEGVESSKSVLRSLLETRPVSDGEAIEDEQAQRFVDEQIISDIIPDDCQPSTSTGRTDETEPSTPADRYRSLRPTLETLGITKVTTDDASAAAMLSMESHEVDDSIITSDMDDDEINSYILTDDEVKMKEEMWMINYEDYVNAMDEKRRVKEEERLKEEQEGGSKKKKNTVRKKKQPMDAALTTSEAIDRIVQEKKLSNKINYEVLKSLIVDAPKANLDQDGPAQVEERVSTPFQADTTPGPSYNRFKPYPIKKAPPETSTTPTPVATTNERRFRVGIRPLSALIKRKLTNGEGSSNGAT